MISYRDLFEVHLRYVDYIREKSLVIHQYVQNITVSGSGVETEVRTLLQSVLPDRFKVTSGYIVGADSRHVEPTVSPQIDVIIVDTLVPHSLWVVDDSSQGVEIVPREAVVGIIEVKRTLEVTSVKSAVEHLGKIVNAVGIRKDDSVSLMPGGGVIGNGLTGPYRGNPLLGIIGLAAKGSFETTPSHTLYTAITQSSTPGLILDFALAMSGIFTATATPNTRNYEPLLVQDSLASAWAEASINTGTNGRVALAQGLGFIQAYIGKTCGRAADAENYFFNDSIV